jgi:hypothetical protein
MADDGNRLVAVTTFGGTLPVCGGFVVERFRHRKYPRQIENVIHMRAMCFSNHLHQPTPTLEQRRQPIEDRVSVADRPVRVQTAAAVRDRSRMSAENLRQIRDDRIRRVDISALTATEIQIGYQRGNSLYCPRFSLAP